MTQKISSNQLGTFLLGIVISSTFVTAFPAVPHGHVHKRQSYARNNQLPAPQDPYYGQASYNSYNYDNYNEQSPGSRRFNNGYRQQNYYDYAPNQQQYYYGGRDPFQGLNPIQREISVRNGQLRQKEYQQRTGQEGRDTYDPFYFYVNPIAAAAAAGAAVGPPVPPPSSGGPPPSPSGSEPAPTTVTAALTAAAVSREHTGGPPRNRRNSLNVPPRPRDAYFDNEISGDKYEILTSKPTYQRLQNSYPHPPPFPSSRYSSGAGSGSAYHHHHQPQGNPNQFLNYEQIVGAEPVRFFSSLLMSHFIIIFTVLMTLVTKSDGWLATKQKLHFCVNSRA